MKYKISIKQGSEELNGKGDTMLEALQSVTPFLKIVGKVFITFTAGDKKKEMMLMPTRAKRLFYPNSQAIMCKQFELLLK